MNKKTQRIMSALKVAGLAHEVLSGDKDNPEKIKIENIGEIWPKNGAIREKDDIVKAGTEYVIDKILAEGGDVVKNTALNTAELIDSIEKLHRRMDELEQLIQSVSVIRRAVKKVFRLFGGGK